MQGNPRASEDRLEQDRPEAFEQAFESAVWSGLQLAWLQQSQAYGRSSRFHGAFEDPEAFYQAPMEVVDDPVLTPEEKRAVLKNWAWHEYLIDLSTAEGMPENGRSTRLDEVERALSALETRLGAAAAMLAARASGRAAA